MIPFIAFLVSLIPIGILIWVFVLLVHHPLKRRYRVREFVRILRFALSQKGNLVDGSAFISQHSDSKFDKLAIRFSDWMVSSSNPSEFLFPIGHGWGAFPRSLIGILKSCFGRIPDAKLLKILETYTANGWGPDGIYAHFKQVTFIPIFIIFIQSFVVFNGLIIFIVPKIVSILDDTLENAPMASLSWPTQALFAVAGHDRLYLFINIFLLVCITIFCSYYLFRGLFQVRFERLARFMESVAERVVPMRRQLIERDFAVVFSICLDAGLPESEALVLACDAMDRPSWRQRKLRAMKDLSDGRGIGTALNKVVQDKALEWRMVNSLHSGGGADLLDSIMIWSRVLNQKARAVISTVFDISFSIFVLVVGTMTGVVFYAIFDILIFLSTQIY